MKLTSIAVAAAAAFVLTACETTPPEPLRANAGIQPTKGNKTFGEATFEQMGDKVQVVVFAQGLAAGQDHALVIHEKGDCGSGDGMSAGAPFAGAAGRLPPLKANKAGRARVTVDVAGLSIGSGAANVVGRGLIVYAGNGSTRIACGVIKAG
jgi:Cu-Zn family superoxide dismutase